jgi:hypothetical protein
MTLPTETETTTATLDRAEAATPDVYDYIGRPVRGSTGRDFCAACRLPIDDPWDAWVIDRRGSMVHSACRQAVR